MSAILLEADIERRPSMSVKCRKRTPSTLDFAQSPWYLRLMTRSVRIVNRKHARFGWAVEGVVR
jgi:hypothetical protein